MSFDAGALLFKIQTVGAQAFKKDLADVEKAVEATAKASNSASEKVEELGTSTDETAKKAQSSKAPLTEQAKATEEVGNKSSDAAKKQREQAKAAQEQKDAADKLSKVLLVAGAAVGAGVALAVAKSTEFGAAMSNVGAATMATSDEQKKLSEAALKAGADTAYSATEAAAAEEELAKAGQSVTDITGGSLSGALSLAAAGQLAVARSAEIMASSLTQFGLGAEDSTHVADLLAAGSGKAQGSVEDLGAALSNVGTVANNTGFSLEETTGFLAAMASYGLTGAEAGTQFKSMLQSLQGPSSVAKKALEELGLSLYDNEGKTKSLSQFVGEYKKSLEGKTQAEKDAYNTTIFGSYGIQAATVAYNEGAEGIEEWTEKVDDSGYAAEQAAMRQDNLAGDIEKLGGAFDTALIQTGSGANDVLREMVKSVTALVDWYGELPAPVQSTAIVLGIAAAAMAIFAGGAVQARLKLAELKTQLDFANVSFWKTAAVGGAAGLALTGVIAVVGSLMAAQAEAQAKAKSYADTLAEGTREVTDATRDMIAENLTADKSFLWVSTGSLADNAETLGLSISTVTDAISGNADALEEVNKVIDKGIEEGYKPMKDANLDAYDAAVYLKEGVEAEIGSIEKATEIARQKADATGESTESSESAAEAYIAEANSVEDLNDQLSDLIDKIMDTNDLNSDAITATSDYQQALSDARDQVAAIAAGTEGYAAGLDIATQAGRDNMDMLQSIRDKTKDYAEAQYALDGDTQGYISRIEEGRQALYDSAIQMGATEEEAASLRDTILAMPTEADIAVLVDTQQAKKDLDGFVAGFAGRQIPMYVTTLTDQSGTRPINKGMFADGAVVSYHANGSVSENHVAQIARAGEWRVWAEPETGGESYIPHAESKRSRAHAIMQETASILGGSYLPPGGIKRFADGGVADVAQASGSQRVEVVVRMTGEFAQYLDAKVQQPTQKIGSAVGGVI